MVADANTARRDKDHNASLHTVARTFGDVRPTSDVIGLLQTADIALSSDRADRGKIRAAPHSLLARAAPICEADTLDLLDSFYRAVEARDLHALRRSLRDDVFMFTPEAAGVFTSAREVADHAAEGFAWLEQNGVTLQIRNRSLVSGKDPSGEVAWAFDQLEINLDGAGVQVDVLVRVTAVLAVDENDGWQVLAGYWSLPFATQAEQDAVKHAGDLEPGAVLVEAVTDDAMPLAALLTEALEEPSLLPLLYSAQPDHATIGSVTDEVFVGPAGRAAWEDFVQHVRIFALRGPMRGALVGDHIGWLAANLDILDPPTPYRFFYVWLREEDGWEVVVSHDAVSRPVLPNR